MTRQLPDLILQKICDYLPSLMTNDLIWNTLMELYPKFILDYLCPQGLIYELKKYEQKVFEQTRLLKFANFTCINCSRINTIDKLTTVYLYEDCYDGPTYDPICNFCIANRGANKIPDTMLKNIVPLTDVPNNYIYYPLDDSSSDII